MALDMKSGVGQELGVVRDSKVCVCVWGGGGGGLARVGVRGWQGGYIWRRGCGGWSRAPRKESEGHILAETERVGTFMKHVYAIY